MKQNRSYLILLIVVLCAAGGCATDQSQGPAVYHADSHREAPRSFKTVVDDSLTLARINKKLFSDDLVARDGIDISVRHGVVHVTGTARDEYHRRMILDLIRMVEGVSRIKDRLELAHKGTQFETAEGMVADRIRIDLIRDPELSDQPVIVTATPTRVILSGRVKNPTLKHHAGTIASSHAGSRKVVNEIRTD